MRCLLIVIHLIVLTIMSTMYEDDSIVSPAEYRKKKKKN